MPSVIVEERAPSVDEYRRLRAAVGWRALPDETMARGLAGALFSACATAGGVVVGAARIVGDGGVYFYLQDVVVLPVWQGHGVGRLLTEACLGWLRAHAPPGAFVGLMAAAGKAGFYEPFGFERRAPDAPGMCRYLSDPG
ncbi:MAG: GNAT family N-acetyltransferase [Pseudomonadota bacterium]